MKNPTKCRKDNRKIEEVTVTMEEENYEEKQESTDIQKTKKISFDKTCGNHPKNPVDDIDIKNTVATIEHYNPGSSFQLISTKHAVYRQS